MWSVTGNDHTEFSRIFLWLCKEYKVRAHGHVFIFDIVPLLA